MELSPFVQEKLQPDHKLISVVESELVNNQTKATRIVTLIEAGSKDRLDTTVDQAIVIFSTARVPVHSSFDLNIEQILPVDSKLKCDILECSNPNDNTVSISIAAEKTKLLLEMPFSERTNGFVSDLLRAAEVIESRKGSLPDFSWLQPYYKQRDGSTDVSNKPVTNASSCSNLSNTSSHFYVPPDVNKSMGDLCDKMSDQWLESEKNPDLNKDFLDIDIPAPGVCREFQLKSIMTKEEHRYTDIQYIKVFVGTWNVNGQAQSIGLTDWLSCDAEPPDIYAIGIQELDLNTETFIFNQTPKEQEWLTGVLNSVHPKARYKKISLIRLVGIMLIVLVQEKHLAYVSKVATHTVGTGLMNKMGNKGGVSVRFDLHRTSICFVNVHMAAHVEEYERRNEDHDCILERTVFNSFISEPSKKIKDHDHIYFFGDMNYRLNAGNYDAKELANKGDLKSLLVYDQLLHQKKVKRIFRNFEEGEIHFKPTYKYDLYTDDWDSSEKARLPAWCDRILWSGEHITQNCYRSHAKLRISDHKPVSAVFTSGIKVLDTRKQRKVYEEVIKNLDKRENEYLPQVAVDHTEIVFDTVKFLEPQFRTLTIANTGQVTVEFRFVAKLDDTNICKPWLSISPSRTTIKPGNACEVTFKVMVDESTASQLNQGNDQVYDILVLHLEGGKDIFITVTGEYERSCFGASIDALVYMNKPFRALTMSELIDYEKGDGARYNEVPYAIPKELFYLIGHLHSNGLKEEGLFTTRGLKKEVLQIIHYLDNGLPNDTLPGSIHSVAETLMYFLDSLAEPVIPYVFYDKALSATPNSSMSIELMKKLPQYHRNVFNYLISFLKDILKHSEENKLDAKTLSKTFGGILLRAPIKRQNKEKANVSSTDDDNKAILFIYHFLVNDYV